MSFLISQDITISPESTSNIGAWTSFPNSADSIGAWIDIEQNISYLPETDISPELDIYAIASGNDIYSLGIENNLNPGEFYYNYDTGELYVYPQPLEPIVLIIAVSEPFRTTNVCHLSIPLFLKNWNVQGNISINRSFQGEPTLSLSFKIYCDQRQKAESELCPSKIVTIWQEWRIQSLSITEIINSNYLEINLSLSSPHASYTDPSRSLLDKPIKLIDGIYKKYRTLGNLAQSVGVQYHGKSMSLRIPRTTSYKTFTTIRQELQKRALIALGFSYYDRSDRVEIRTWANQTNHLISCKDVISDPEFNYSGTGALVDGVKLSKELRNTVLNLDFDSDKQGNTGSGCVWEFENANDFYQVTIPAEPKGWYLQTPSVDILRSPSINFDTGGFTKKAKKTTLINGVAVEIEEWTYGYNFTTSDVYRVVEANDKQIIIFNRATFPQVYWREVKHTKTINYYDTEGYLYRVATTGNELARLKQESDELEAINLQRQAVEAGLSTPEAFEFLEQAKAYEFVRQMPVTETIDYSLVALREYFSDIQSPEDGDTNWVEPRFVDIKTRNRDDYIVGDDPESTEDDPLPPIFIRQKLQENERVTITQVGNPDRFIRSHSTSTQKDKGAVNTSYLVKSSQNIGRPSIHTRLEPNIDETPYPNYELYKDYKFWLSSPDSDSDYKCEENSVSYPEVDNPELARAIAETELSIENSQNAIALSLNILYRDGLEVGDFITYRGRKYVIFGISYSLEIEQNRFLCSNGINLSLGRYVAPEVSLRQIKPVIL